MADNRSRNAAFDRSMQTLRLFVNFDQDAIRDELWLRDGPDWDNHAIGAGHLVDPTGIDGAFTVDAAYAAVPFAAR